MTDTAPPMQHAIETITKEFHRLTCLASEGGLHQWPYRTFLRVVKLRSGEEKGVVSVVLRTEKDEHVENFWAYFKANKSVLKEYCSCAVSQCLKKTIETSLPRWQVSTWYSNPSDEDRELSAANVSKSKSRMASLGVKTPVVEVPVVVADSPPVVEKMNYHDAVSIYPVVPKTKPKAKAVKKEKAEVPKAVVGAV
jgi:hypothetical protein